MDPKDTLKIMEMNPDLARSLEYALLRNAGEDEIASMLSDVGIDATVADDLLSSIQRKRGTVIGTQGLDDNEFDQVAGGGTGSNCGYTGDCDERFNNADYSNKHCQLFSVCDEVLGVG